MLFFTVYYKVLGKTNFAFRAKIMSQCRICGSNDSSHPKEWERECTACLTDSIKGVDGTLTPPEKRLEYRRRSKWMQT